MWELRQGNCLDLLKQIPSETIQTCVTSPPYFGLRDYNTSPIYWPEVSYQPMTGLSEIKIPTMTCSLGLEPTPEAFVGHMVLIFREVRRVLRQDGTLWLNFGDSYCSTAPNTKGDPIHKKGYFSGVSEKRAQASARIRPKTPDGLKPKDLVGIPWRIAFALQADGWYLRSDIIWAKPNPMPESVIDRPTKAHEYIFLLSKSEKYFYDKEAIKEPFASATYERIKQATFDQQKGGPKDGINPNRSCRKTIVNLKKRLMAPQLEDRILKSEGRNKRTVWIVPTKPYPESHFAVFPPDLIEPCILAGSALQSCPKCGSPWERVVERKSNTLPVEERHGRQSHNGQPPQQSGMYWKPPEISEKGFQPTCACLNNDGSGRSVVPAPAKGSSTTLMVAEKNGRDSIGLELNTEYCKIINKRLESVVYQGQLFA